jgi:hypothetical protein
MTKYYVGYTQGNGDYVYVSNIDYNNVRVTTVFEGAIAFDDVELAKGLLNICKTMVANQEYVVLEMKTSIKEVK